MATTEGRDWIADYQVVRPLGPPSPRTKAFLALAPSRLHDAPPEVAVHLLDADPARFALAVEHLRAVAAARSPRIVTLLEAGRDERGEPVAYFATSYQERGSLATRAPTGIRARLRALAQAARGVHDLHQAGRVYGTVGPGSVLLGDEGALLAVPQPPSPLEVGETIMAEPTDRLETVDPAVIRGEGRSRATDVWSLGATIHLVLAQRSLHPGLASDDPLTAVQRVLFEPPAIDVRLPPDQAAVIASCLQPNPEDRPASAEDVALSLEALAAAR